jgi:hypothetical protein
VVCLALVDRAARVPVGQLPAQVAQHASTLCSTSGWPVRLASRLTRALHARNRRLALRPSPDHSSGLPDRVDHTGICSNIVLICCANCSVAGSPSCTHLMRMIGFMPAAHQEAVHKRPAEIKGKALNCIAKPPSRLSVKGACETLVRMTLDSSVCD